MWTIIHPSVAKGPTVEDNLALACVSCSLRKGARMTAVDPVQVKKSHCFIRAGIRGVFIFDETMFC